MTLRFEPLKTWVSIAAKNRKSQLKLLFLCAFAVWTFAFAALDARFQSGTFTGGFFTVAWWSVLTHELLHPIKYLVQGQGF